MPFGTKQASSEPEAIRFDHETVEVRDKDLTSIIQVVVDGNAAPSDNPAWFPGAKLNWAQNQLRCRSNKVAIIQASK